MKKSVAIWQIIIGVLVLIYELLRVFIQQSAYGAGFMMADSLPLILLGIFALITGLANLNKK